MSVKADNARTEKAMRDRAAERRNAAQKLRTEHAKGVTCCDDCSRKIQRRQYTEGCPKCAAIQAAEKEAQP